MSLRRVRVVLALLVVAGLFVLAFQEPAIFFRQMEKDSKGLLTPAGYVTKTSKQMALASLVGPFFGNFAGLANPLLLIGCWMILRQRTRSAFICLGWATLAALQTFQLMILPYHEDEGGVVMSYMVRPLAGWYCWFGAILLAFLLALEQRWSSHQDALV